MRATLLPCLTSHKNYAFSEFLASIFDDFGTFLANADPTGLSSEVLGPPLTAFGPVFRNRGETRGDVRGTMLLGSVSVLVTPKVTFRKLF